MTDNHARVERAELCELLATLGPDAPTLCTGWLTRDLAAHLILRERRPLAAAGIVLRPVAGYTTRVQRAIAATPFPELVDRLRTPPWWLRPVDRAMNTLEMFIHHEDVRRAQPDWRPRDLTTMEAALWRRASPAARLRLRRFPATVLVSAPGHDTLRTGRGGTQLRLAGPPSELVLFLTGRQRVAQVDLTGPDALTAQLASAHLAL